MKTSPVGLALIEKYEGDKLHAYRDSNGVWTIGYGHTGNVHIGEYETQEQAESDLCEDVDSAEDAVNAFVQVPLTQNQFDALVSFTYNEGSGRLLGSTLLKDLNGGSYALAADQFPKWDMADGKPSDGLLARRDAEQTLFCTP